MPPKNADVLIDGQQLVEREALRHVADPPLDPFGIARDVDAADRRGPGRRLQQPAQHADGRRLAGAVAAEEAEDLAARDVEADASTATNWPKRRVRSRTCDRGASLPAKRPRQPRLGEADGGDRARAIELGLEQRDLRVEHLGAGRDAGLVALADDALGFGGRADAVVGGGDGLRGSTRARARARAPRRSPAGRTRRPAS